MRYRLCQRAFLARASLCGSLAMVAMSFSAPSRFPSWMLACVDGCEIAFVGEGRVCICMTAWVCVCVCVCVCVGVSNVAGGIRAH